MGSEPNGILVILFILGGLFCLFLIFSWIFVPFILMGISKRLDRLIDNVYALAGAVGQPQAASNEIVTRIGRVGDSIESLKPFLKPLTPEPPQVERPRKESTVSFRCPFCNVPLKAPAEDAGRMMDCPKCGKTGTVPPA